MLNTNFIVSSYNNNQAILSWTSANPDTISHVFLNGNKVIGNALFPSVNRVILIPAPTIIGCIVEIHDFEANDLQDSVLSITVPSNKLPLLSWEAVSDAVKYKIYANNSLVQTIQKIQQVDIYTQQITTKDFYGKIGTWHFFTVTAIDLYGNESILKYFPHYIWDLPPLISNLTVVEGSMSGKYDFTITL